MTDIQSVVEEIEAEQGLGRISADAYFRSMINQPQLISLNTADATPIDSTFETSTYNFNLPRPILQAKTIQLINANIPAATTSISDTASVFWYYRLSGLSSEIPCLANLYCIRLLSSHTKPELITNSALYGVNRIFDSYTDILTELSLSCANDVGYTNYLANNSASVPFFQSQFIPDEISFSINSQQKIEMTGNSATTTPAWVAWSSITAYVVGNRVYATRAGTNPIQSVFVCIQNSTNNTPSSSPLYWKETMEPYIHAWEGGAVRYTRGQYVSYGGSIWYCDVDTITATAPSGGDGYWILVNPATPRVWNRYLITGFNDPNVAIAQGMKSYVLYEPTMCYYSPDIVVESGHTYKALLSSLGKTPSTNPTFWQLQSKAITSILGTTNTLVVSVDNSGSFFVNGNEVYIYDTGNTNYNSIPDYSYYQTPVSFTISSTTTTSITLVSTRGVGVSVGGYVSLRLPPILGLSQFSRSLDYYLATPITAFQLHSMPYQTFASVPKRILNSVLGFSWNGLFVPSQFTGICSYDFAIGIYIKDAPLINRLRPIPYYVILDTGLSLGVELDDSPALTTNIFTADGYCNLVYTSMLHIIGSIVGGSTLDSKINMGLLASGTMDCANLGVSFFHPSVDNALAVLGDDIYAIRISLLDEAGDPYNLGLNAICSFILKVEYKGK